MYFFSCKNFQTQLHKGFDPTAVCSRTIFKLQFVQEQCKLTINYCLVFFHTRIFFDITSKCWVGLKICTNTSKMNLKAGKKTQIWGRWRRKKSLTCIGTIIVKWIWWNQTYQNINSYLVFRCGLCLSIIPTTFWFQELQKMLMQYKTSIWYAMCI